MTDIVGRANTIDGCKRALEMKRGKTGFLSQLVQRNRFRKIFAHVGSSLAETRCKILSRQLAGGGKALFFLVLFQLVPGANGTVLWITLQCPVGLALRRKIPPVLFTVRMMGVVH